MNGHGVGSQVAAHERLVETGPLYDLAQRPFGSLHIRLFDGAVGLGHDKRVLGVLFENGGYGGAHVAPFHYRRTERRRQFLGNRGVVPEESAAAPACRFGPDYDVVLRGEAGQEAFARVIRSNVRKLLAHH